VIPPSALHELAEKYRTLARLRREKASGEDPPPRETFRRLAERFPGVLNELDTLTLEELDARARDLELAAAGAPVEPWMEWLWTFHALLRAALYAKRRPVSDDEIDRLARDASAHAGIDVERGFIGRVSTPPGGRIVRLVLEEVGRRFACDGDRVRSVLFPRRRAERTSAD
jgi:hypothetical protein